jgi:hypothetical protein
MKQTDRVTDCCSSSWCLIRRIKYHFKTNAGQFMFQIPSWDGLQCSLWVSRALVCYQWFSYVLSKCRRLHFSRRVGINCSGCVKNGIRWTSFITKPPKRPLLVSTITPFSNFSNAVANTGLTIFSIQLFLFKISLFNSIPFTADYVLSIPSCPVPSYIFALQDNAIDEP